MKKALILLAMALSICACKGTKTLLPNVSGKAGEVIIVMDRDNWEGNPGLQIRELLGCDCPYLPLKEPLYNLVNVTPGGFADLFKVHRNIVFFDFNPDASGKVTYLHDIWASPQCVVNVSVKDAEDAVRVIKANGANIVSAIEMAERERVIANSIRYEEKDIAVLVSEVFGDSPRFPSGYKLKKRTSDFAWVADDKQVMQAVLIYKYPALGNEHDFDQEQLVAMRNEVLKANVPGMFENTYMTTSTAFPIKVEFIRYRGREFAQMRGLWDVQGDFMGGPFVSHSFYSPDGKDIIVLDAFVYAPKYDKRQYLRQVESILYSWGVK